MAADDVVVYHHPTKHTVLHSERANTNSCVGEGEEGMDSFIDHDMEDDMAGGEGPPGSATKKRKGLRGKALYGVGHGATPQAAIQPGATPSGAAQTLDP